MYLATMDDDIATSTTVASTDGNAVTTGVQQIVTLLNDDIATSAQSIGTNDCCLLTIHCINGKRALTSQGQCGTSRTGLQIGLPMVVALPSSVVRILSQYDGGIALTSNGIITARVLITMDVREHNGIAPVSTSPSWAV